MTVDHLYATLGLVLGAGGSMVGGWFAVDWWTVRRPLRAPSDEGRALRLARIEAGKPPRYICTDCGRKLRKHCHQPSWANKDVHHGVEICDGCILAYPDRDDFHKWMSFDIVTIV